MAALSFLGVALLIPLIVVLGNGFLRWLFGSPQSAAADLILAMVVFDAAVAVQAQDFQPFVGPEFIKNNVPLIYTSLLIVNMFTWIAVAFRLEASLLSAFDFENRHYTKNPKMLIFISYVISVFVLVTNTLAFAWAG